MGINGLYSFVDNKENWLREHKLCKTKVIVDGCNLLCTLYTQFKCEWVFSGEYDFFASKLKKFFEDVKKCEIELIIILDGCCSISGNKEWVLISRAKQKLDALCILNEMRQSRALFPNLMVHTFMSVLRECHIQHLTCPEEADSNIAVLANHLNCPVLTNDSDFYIFDLPGGVIPISSLKFFVRTENCQCCPSKKHRFLNCKLFKQSFIELPDNLTLNLQLMPLWGTLLGNDYAKDVDFNSIIHGINLPANSNSNSKRSFDIFSLLVWLHRFSSVETAVDGFLRYVPDQKRIHTSDVIQESLREYSLSDEWILKKMGIKPSNENEVDQYFDWLPERLREQFYKGKLNKVILSCIYTGQARLSVIVEDVSMPSVYYASLDIRRILYSLYSPIGCEKKVTEIIRDERKFIECDIDLGSLEDYKQLPIDKSSLLTVLNIRMNSIPFEDSSPFCSLIAIMKCWLVSTKHSLENVRCEILATLLTAFYHIVQKFRSEVGVTPEDKYRMDSKMKGYLEPCCYNERNPINLKFVHHYNEIQTCYNFFIDLNYYFNSCFRAISPQHMFCGRLFYNLCFGLDRYKCAEDFISQILGGWNSDLFRMFDQLYSAVKM